MKTIKKIADNLACLWAVLKESPGLTLAIFACLYYLVGAIQYKEHVSMPRAYATWCKHTKNPSGVTYEEWVEMVRAGD